MSNSKSKYIYLVLLTIAVILALYSSISLILYGSPLTKSYNEHLISGNKLYNDSLYDDAIEHYLRARSIDSLQCDGNFNSATNLLMKIYDDGRSQNDVSAALVNESDRLYDLAYDNSSDKTRLSEIMHNQGVLRHITDSLEKAEVSYKMALRSNPDDEGSRYNLAVVQYLLKKNQQQQQQQQQQQEQQQQNQQDNKDNNQQEQQQQQQQQQEQQQQEQQQNQEQNNKNDDNKDKQDKNQGKQGQNQQNPGQQNGKGNENSDLEAAEAAERSKEEAERILNAVVLDEKSVLEKVNKDKEKKQKKNLQNAW